MPEKHEDGGMTSEQLAGTAFAALRSGMGGEGPNGQKLPQWSELPEEVQVAWVHTAARVVESLEQNEGQALPAIYLAQQTYENYARATGRGNVAVAWEALPPKQRWAWEAVVRHVANCVCFEDPAHEDLERHERHWKGWVENKVALNGGV